MRIVILLLFLSSCGWRSIPTALNDVEASWAQVENQYKRRADLIPNLVNVVKAYKRMIFTDEFANLSSIFFDKILKHTKNLSQNNTFNL